MARSTRRKKSSSDCPEEQTYLNLARTQDYVQRELVRLFATCELTAPQYNVLRILRDVGNKGLPSLEIAKRLITRMPDVSRLVDRLAEAGLVERARVAEDARVVLVRISGPGLSLLTHLDGPVLKLYKKLLGHLSRTDLSELNSLLVEARRGE
jgi:DNA-binding MarR family transcriptional regulator